MHYSMRPSQVGIHEPLLPQPKHLASSHIGLLTKQGSVLAIRSMQYSEMVIVLTAASNEPRSKLSALLE